MPRIISTMMHRIKAKVPVHRLFVTIFLWFWLTALGTLGLVWISGRFTGMHVVAPPNMYATVAPILAEQAVHAYETGGAAAFSQFSLTKVGHAERQLYLLDGFDQDVLSRPVSAEGLRVARAAKVGQLLVLRSNIAAFKIISPSGHPYILMLYMRSALGQVGELFSENGIWFSLGILSLITVFCFSLAYHIAVPIHSIQFTARRVANGDLKARVPSQISKRYDELSALAIDFDSMVDRLETLIDAQRNLLSSVSHELRSPLTRINLSVDLLRRFPSADNQDTFRRLDRDVNRIDLLMGQLLMLSQLEAGLSSGEREDFNLTQLVQEVVADANFEAKSLGKAVSLDAPALIMIRNASPHSLRSACENTIRNAVRYTSPGTVVEVVLRERKNSVGSQASISVKDQGPGVPHEYLDTIFQPFVRVENSESSLAGNGLGLAIAAEAIRAHHGSLHAANLEPSGLEIVIELPL